jgi:hypothetical protein
VGTSPGHRTQIATELSSYFAGAFDEDLELGSSWGPLVDAATGGFVGGHDYDRGMVGRVARRRGKRDDIAAARRVRDALRAIPVTNDGPSAALVLVARYGPIAWSRRLDDAQGKHMSGQTWSKGAKKLGDLFGVAVVAADLAGIDVEAWISPPAPVARVTRMPRPQDEKRRGVEYAELRAEREAKKPPTAKEKDHAKAARPCLTLTPREYALISICLAKDGLAAVARIKVDAHQALRAAEDAYQDARAATDPAYTYLRQRAELREATPSRRANSPPLFPGARG